MEAEGLLNEIRAGGIELKAEGDFIAFSGQLSQVQQETIRRQKPALLKILRREKRQQSLLKMMAEDDQSRRSYWLTDDKSDPDFVILAGLVKGDGFRERSIPRASYDPWQLLEMLEKGQLLIEETEVNE